MPVERRNTGARIEDQQRRIGILNCTPRLQLHFGFEFGTGYLFKPGGIDSGKAQFSEHRVAFTAIARYTRGRVDERRPPSDQAVKQRRFPHIRAADDSDDGFHDFLTINEMRSGRLRL